MPEPALVTDLQLCLGLPGAVVFIATLRFLLHPLHREQVPPWFLASMWGIPGILARPHLTVTVTLQQWNPLPVS